MGRWGVATKDKILNTLAAQGGPITLKRLSEILGEAQGNFFTQLDRMSKSDPPLVTKDEDKKWVITEDGRQSLQQSQDEDERPPDEVLRNSEEPSAVISEYQKFMQLGRQSGISNAPLLKAVCDHVWAGDFHDLKAVHAALIQANISPDLANRWVAFWGSYLKQTITPELEQMMAGAKVQKDGNVTEGKSLRDKLTHIINPDTGLPMYVGAGNGDYTYEDAKELASQFLASRARGNNAAGGTAHPSDSIDQAIRISELITKNENATPPQKKYLAKVNADGTATVEEYDQDKPLIVQTGPAAAVAPTGTAGLTGQVDQITALVNALISLGIVVKPGQNNNGAPPQKIIYLDKDGKPMEVNPGQPIIIYRDQPAPAAPNPMSSMPVTITGADGKPITVAYDQLHQFFAIEEWKDKRRREEDKHAGQMELVSTFKDLAKKGTAALQDLAASKGAAAK
jgi:hypothetical protein